jgi:hypothetical protein
VARSIKDFQVQALRGQLISVTSPETMREKQQQKFLKLKDN